MAKPVEVEVVLSYGEHLPAVDVWLVIDILRASTVMVRWFELGGKDIYMSDSINAAKHMARILKSEGQTPILMGERNAIAPPDFDLGNSPVEITREVVRQGSCAVMATSNGTRAILKAASAGAPVFVACARNAAAVLNLALSKGRRLGIFCAGRRNRPAWDDTLCAGLLIGLLRDVYPDLRLADSARLAFLAWESSSDFRSSLAGADHAVFLEKIGFGNDILFSSEINVANSVPVLNEEPDGEGMRISLREGMTHNIPLIIHPENIRRSAKIKETSPVVYSPLSLPEKAAHEAELIFFGSDKNRRQKSKGYR